MDVVAGAEGHAASRRLLCQCCQLLLNAHQLLLEGHRLIVLGVSLQGEAVGCLHDQPGPLLV